MRGVGGFIGLALGVLAGLMYGCAQRPTTLTTGAEPVFDDRVLGLWEEVRDAEVRVEGEEVPPMRIRIAHADPKQPKYGEDGLAMPDGYLITMDRSGLWEAIAARHPEVLDDPLVDCWLQQLDNWELRVEFIELDAHLIGSAALSEPSLNSLGPLFSQYLEPLWQAWRVSIEGSSLVIESTDGGMFGLGSPTRGGEIRSREPSWRARAAKMEDPAKMRRSLVSAMRSGDAVFTTRLELQRIE